MDIRVCVGADTMILGDSEVRATLADAITPKSPPPFFFFVFLPFLGLLLQHKEVPRLGV